MSSPRNAHLAALLFACWAVGAAAAQAGPALRHATCANGSNIVSEQGVLDCTYTAEKGYRPTHDGGPWFNVDLLHVTRDELFALRAGTSNAPIYPSSPDDQKPPPRIPPLGLVHAQVCLSDPDVVYSQCPNTYPDNPGNEFYKYQLNPQLIPLLERGLDRIRRAGLKVVLRFTYNWPCPPGEKGPRCNKGVNNDAPMHVILQHMRDLAPTIRRNSDVIFALQAGFIGRWGEWHNSTNDNDLPAAHNKFLDEYRSLFLGYTNLEVRQPYVILDYLHYLKRPQTDEAMLSLGLGMHDDEFGSDPTDGGTFLPEPKSAAPNARQYDSCKLKRVMHVLSGAYTMTGETTGVDHFSTRSDCGGGIPDPRSYEEFASDYSLTTLQLGFSPQVMRYWVNKGMYHGILERIGPHLSLVSARLQLNPDNQRASLSITLRNTGWAKISRERRIYFVLRAKDQTAMKRNLSLDLRDVEPGQTLTRTMQLGVWNKLGEGGYDAYLWTPDASPKLADNAEYALIFESVGVPRPQEGLNALGSFTLSN